MYDVFCNNEKCEAHFIFLEGAVAYAYGRCLHTHQMYDVVTKKWGTDVSIGCFTFEEDGRVWVGKHHLTDGRVQSIFDLITCCGSYGICEGCTKDCNLRPLTPEEYEDFMEMDE